MAKVSEQERIEIERQIRRRMKAKRKAKIAQKRLDEGPINLNLNSMMDMMTIILVFLLKSYGEEPIKVTKGTDVPFSTSEIAPSDMTVVTITDDSIVLLEKEVVKLTGRKVDKAFKKGGDAGLVIVPLETSLREEVEKQKNVANQTKREFKGEMTIVADLETPYRLIAEVMQTAIASEFKKFRFAVIKAGFADSGTAATN